MRLKLAHEEKMHRSQHRQWYTTHVKQHWPHAHSVQTKERQKILVNYTPKMTLKQPSSKPTATSTHKLHTSILSPTLPETRFHSTDITAAVLMAPGSRCSASCAS
ncbi:hypothetical protein DUNSADRAFT_3747 [Dunaliella salina]|uniref:Encoded protein n=1 Tax=Dunaliella salina TaxID=3046 RepID=A0ABQ7GTB9_DUNSA|nr:hypothetical protein DUNSADRAFT_3747 [Dunaliella salina]|eukprot:KAF5837854.1 hypothetical protein DUNSADRAFT_3747 [Dunaliella salina]